MRAALRISLQLKRILSKFRILFDLNKYGKHRIIFNRILIDMKNKNEKFSFHFSLKYFSLIIITFFIIFAFEKNKEENALSFLSDYQKKFENQLKLYICEIFNTQECSYSLFNNMNYFNEIKDISGNITLLIELNRTNIENLIFSYHIKNIKTYKILKQMLRNISICNTYINITQNEFEVIRSNIFKFLHSKWKIIPNQNIINIIRFALNNYYKESDLQLFDEILNLNIEYYIKSNNLPVDIKKSLTSKFFK